MCDVAGRQVVLSPFGATRVVPLAAGAGARFAGPLADSRVAIIDNQILGMAELADQLEPVLRQVYGVRDVRRWSVPHSRAVDPDTTTALIAASDVMILGLGNCGACTTWNCEVTAFLAAQVPVMNVVTRRFVGVALAALRARGHPAPALAVVSDTPDLLLPSTLSAEASSIAAATVEQLTLSDAR
jgi:hypothetical protein